MREVSSAQSQSQAESRWLLQQPPGHHRLVPSDSIVWLSSVLVVPALLALMLLMEWLENRFAQRMVADQVAVAFSAAKSADELEEMIARSVAPLFNEATR